MASKYGKKSQEKIEKVMKERKSGTLKSGSTGKKVTSRKQAIAIGLSEARRAGGKVPAKKSAAKKSAPAKKSATKKSAAKKSTAKKSPAKKSASKKSTSKKSSSKKK